MNSPQRNTKYTNKTTKAEENRGQKYAVFFV